MSRFSTLGKWTTRYEDSLSPGMIPSTRLNQKWSCRLKEQQFFSRAYATEAIPRRHFETDRNGTS